MKIEVVVKIDEIEASVVPFDIAEVAVTEDNRVVFKNTTRDVEYVLNVFKDGTVGTALISRDYCRKDAVMINEAQVGVAKAATLRRIYHEIVARAEEVRQRV